ncbi:hypothetical protein OF83DRAFT_1102877 [Amylostereum chailletii]|nr:hypothetical protein OF83DRAFT_1102877 [Amylostereum chailletii]
MESDSEPFSPIQSSAHVLDPALATSGLPPRSPSPNSIRQARLAAHERRQAAAAAERPTNQPFQAFDDDYEKRTEFRRLIEPGILRPNAKEVALSSLRTLLKIAQNLLKEPDNPKFRQFKPTNTIIKRDLVDPKGALEYAIALGFRPEVDNFQPLYIFNTRHWNDLRMGAHILEEVLTTETEKAAREAHSRETKKAEEAARVEKVKKAFMDDRKTRALRDQREKAYAVNKAKAQSGSGQEI